MQRLIDLLFPEGNNCHLCSRGLSEAGILCTECLDALHSRMYRPAAVVHADAHPPLSLCVSAFPHADEPRRLVHLLKYTSDSTCAQLLGEAMAHAFACVPVSKPDAQVVVPVPLHASRTETRGYNQALLLAQTVSDCLGLPMAPEALTRNHATDTQLHRNRFDRLQAMQFAFSSSDEEAIRGKNLLLVDDVLTTGATAMACARVLLKAGASSVMLLTACRA